MKPQMNTDEHGSVFIRVHLWFHIYRRLGLRDYKQRRFLLSYPGSCVTVRCFLNYRFGGVVNIRRYLSYAMTLAVFAFLPAPAQDRRTTSSETERGRVSDAGLSRGMGSVGGRGVSVGSPSVSTGSRTTGSGVSTGSGFDTRTGERSAGGSAYVPKLQGTSFCSMNNYFMWQDFMWNLQTRYSLDAMYLRRFYRN